MNAALPPAAAPEEDVTTTLYRAAIGPVRTDYYLPIFTRFEAADHAGISWNSAASLATLNWLMFRQLWAAALGYAGMVLAILLLVFGIGRLVFQFSDSLMMILGLGFGLAAFVLPGLFGNAVLHTECRKRMAKELAAHPVVADACAALTRQAPTRKRAAALAIANAVFWTLAVFSYLQLVALSTLAVMPHGALESGQVAVGRAVEMAAQSSAPLASTASAPVSAPASSPASTTASAPATASSSAAAASEPRSSASAPMAPVSAALVPAAAASALPATTAPAATAASTTSKAASVPVASPPPMAVASAHATKASVAASNPANGKERVKKVAAKPAQALEPQAAASKAKKTSKPDKTAQAPEHSASATPKRAASATTSASATASDKPFFINVGLFANPENAARAHAKLLEAQLPSVTKELKSAKVPLLIRVRVGPYASQEEAQAAVEKIKSLQLDAIVVQP